MKDQVLLLNRFRMPLETIHWHRAVYLLHLDKAELVSVEPDRYLNSPHTQFKFPSIVALKGYSEFRMKKLPLTRSNLFRRDKYTCMYCGERFPQKELTLDHLHPSSRGGRTTWKNLVSACYPCNSDKGDKTAAEYGYPDLVGFRPNPIYMGECKKEWEIYLKGG